MPEPMTVLLMAYGTPATVEEIPAYYTHIRRGRPPTEEQLSGLTARYEAIGGLSPLLRVSRAQAEGLEQALNRSGEGAFTVRVAMKHAHPFIEEAVSALAVEDAQRVVGLVLAPHYSALSIGEYRERALEAMVESGAAFELEFIDSWHLAPGYVRLLAANVRQALESLPASAREDSEVVFTAHSLPERIIQMNDPYPRQLEETAAAVAEQAGLARWSLGWQSAGRTPEPWLGPDILDVMRDRAAAGRRGLVVCPAGFVSDHLEILYDLDVEASALARKLGLSFARTKLPNDDAAFVQTLADVALERLAAVPK